MQNKNLISGKKISNFRGGAEPMTILFTNKNFQSFQKSLESFWESIIFQYTPT